MTDRDDHTEDRDARPDAAPPDETGTPDAPPAATDAEPAGAETNAESDEIDAEPPEAAEQATAEPPEAAEPREPDASPTAADGGTEKVASATDGATDGGDKVVEGAGGSRWRRLAAAVFTPKLTAANMVIALLVGLLGFALIVQVRSNANESTLVNDRPDDLVRILSDLDARKDRLSNEISSLQSTVQQLNSGAQGRQAALDAAAKRADELGILGGTLPATGPGLIINLTPADKQQIPANTVLDTVEELRGAGAEAMQIGGTGAPAVRIVASTYFVDADGGVSVDGNILGGTLSITAIGDPQTIQAALSIPGGVVDTVHNDGGTVQLDTPGTVEVTALHAPEALRYAHPVS
jgi:uncharacterized protein YlxW (UPF0749 family)